MTPTVRLLLQECVCGKTPDDHVFTRRTNGRPVRDFRKAWRTACVAAGVGRVVTRTVTRRCPVRNARSAEPQGNPLRYSGLIFHDARRTAARNLRRAGVSEGVIMRIGGWRTRSVFERYNIVSQADIVDALEKLEQRRAVRLEMERQNEERRNNPTFDFGTNTVPIGLAAGDSRARAKSGKVN